MIRSFRHSRVLICMLLVLVTTAIYSQVVRSEFVNYDDNDYVTANPHVKAGLTVRSVAWAFTSAYASNWHPLTWLSHMLDVNLYGLKPWGHHFNNLLLHLLNIVLLFLLLARMTGAMWRSAFVAALFALHPLHVESVAWVAERKDVLSSAFWLLTIWAYAKYASSPSIKRYLPVIVLFALGLMAKPMLVSLPLVLLLLDYWPLGRVKTLRPGMGLVLEKLPLFLLAAASCVVTYVVQLRSGAISSTDSIPLGVRAANAFVAYVAYVGKVLWPARLAVIYPHPHGSLSIGLVVGACAALVATTVFALRRRTRGYLTVGWLWYAITLIPVIGFVQVGEQAMADRYTYIPLIGLFIAIAWGAPEILGRVGWGTRPVAIVGCVALLASSACTWAQVGYWRNSVTLFQHAVDVTSDNYIACNNLADAFEKRGRTSEAAEFYGEAVEIRPNSYSSRIKLAELLLSEDKAEDAEAEYAAAEQYGTATAETHRNRGLALHRLGREGEAIAQYRKAIELKPDFAAAHSDLGVSLVARGRTDEGIAQYLQAIRLDPHSAEAESNLGIALAGKNRLDEAMPHFLKAVQIQPEYAKGHINLAVAYYVKGNYAEAWRECYVARQYGEEPDAGFLRALSQKMPDPAE